MNKHASRGKRETNEDNQNEIEDRGRHDTKEKQSSTHLPAHASQLALTGDHQQAVHDLAADVGQGHACREGEKPS